MESKNNELEDLINKLKESLPDEAIKQHPTKTYLSTIKGIYVTERFNSAFGVGKWTTKIQVEHVNHDTGMVIIKLIFQVPELSIYYESFGGNDNGGMLDGNGERNKGFDLGDAYKGATTDALTKIGSWLEVGIDVFKGKYNNPKNNNNHINVTWFSEEQFNNALVSTNIKRIENALEAYNSKTHKMKTVYIKALEKRIGVLIDEINLNKKS